MKIALRTGFALAAFAMNSVLCRLALGQAAIDAASFSTVRLSSGAAILLLITFIKGRRSESVPSGSWTSAAFLFLYAIAFSLAYLNLSAGTGALILFGSVQATMLAAALWSGERPHLLEWLGLALAISGLIWLVFPGLKAPPLLSSALMALAGISWGIYSLRGRGAKDPLAATTTNFVRSVPLIVAVSLLMLGSFHVSAKGLLLAVLSGALASALGYVIWYSALKSLTATRAALVQLAVPLLAAMGGVALLSEEITIRLLVAALMILGGVGLALLSRRPVAKRSQRA